MSIKLIEHPFSYKEDYEKKVIYLTKNHLKDSEKRVLDMDGNAIYNVNYSGIKKYVREHIKKYENSGYMIIFEYEGKRILLVYNKHFVTDDDNG
jgi:hypothetical protein